jgi:xylan 1,4-beta-xylosidase
VLPVAPSWATGRFWAPELAYDHQRFVAFYSATRVGGGPCIGVATASRAEGPWRDRGRAVCPPGGAIDPFFFRDTEGGRWLVYKARGPQGGIRLQRLNWAGLRAVGRSIRAIGPDQPWEQGVTEGPDVVVRGGMYYLFYSGGHCCRPPCSYAEGVARASSPLGPWIKAPAPVLTGDDAFRCPGHGTVVDLGEWGTWLVHHGYAATDLIDARREVLLTELQFAPDGWPIATSPPTRASSPLGGVQVRERMGFLDGFGGSALAPGWEWLFDSVPQTTVARSELGLSCNGGLKFVARQVPIDRWLAIATVDTKDLDDGVGVGLAANLGRGVRGVELTSRGAHAFAASPGVRRFGRTVPLLGEGRYVRLAIRAAPGGALWTYAGRGTAPLRWVTPGPAAHGSGPTRVALTCRDTGTARFTSVRVRPLPGA